MSGLKEGIHPRIVAFFKKVAKRVSDGGASFEEMRPVLEFVAPVILLLGCCSPTFRESWSVTRDLKGQPTTFAASLRRSRRHKKHNLLGNG